MLRSKRAQLSLGTLGLQGKNKALSGLELLKKHMTVTPGLSLCEGEAGMARKTLTGATSGEILGAYKTDLKPLDLYSDTSRRWQCWNLQTHTHQ